MSAFSAQEENDESPDFDSQTRLESIRHIVEGLPKNMQIVPGSSETNQIRKPRRIRQLSKSASSNRKRSKPTLRLPAAPRFHRSQIDSVLYSVLEGEEESVSDSEI